MCPEWKCPSRRAVWFPVQEHSCWRNLDYKLMAFLFPSELISLCTLGKVRFQNPKSFSPLSILPWSCRVMSRFLPQFLIILGGKKEQSSFLKKGLKKTTKARWGGCPIAAAADNGAVIIRFAQRWGAAFWANAEVLEMRSSGTGCIQTLTIA